MAEAREGNEPVRISRVGRPPIQDPHHLSPTQSGVLVLLYRRGEVPCSKREMARELGVSVDTVGHALINLKRRGLIVATARHEVGGGQVASAYAVTDLARETYPELLGVTSPVGEASSTSSR